MDLELNFKIYYYFIDDTLLLWEFLLIIELLLNSDLLGDIKGEGDTIF